MTVDPASSAPSRGRERRRWPRAKADWPISLELPEGRFEARVRDVSEAGVCCFLDRPLDLMVVLGIELEFPGMNGATVSGQGIVVRSERISEALDHYEIAVFMPDLSAEDKRTIATYVRDHPELAAR